MTPATIIILTYNSSRFIEELLKSLRDFANGAEILLVDNASSDDTVKLAKKFGSEIKIIETGSNLGFAKGNNFGANKATGDYLLFLNSDTSFKNGKLSDMISVFEKNEKAGVVGGKLTGRDGTAEKSAGRFFNLIETLLMVLGLDEALGVRFSPSKLSKVDFVSGGFMMVRSKLFKSLNGFDENFFMYIEDMEFCYRAKKSGFETYFTPDVSISHVGQGSSSRAFAVANIYKGILYFYKKHKSRPEYEIVRCSLWFKAQIVYFLGKLTNNEYYTDTYGQALKVFK